MERMLDVRGVTKRFGGLTALRHVDMDVNAGEVVGLIKVGWFQVNRPLPSKVPLFTATVLGGEVRLKPRPA